MAEEDTSTTITNDDLSALRVLLHNVKGLSTVSSTSYSSVQNDATDE